MIEQLQARLAELKREYQLGEGQLRELTRQEAALRETLLRISGAIQVLEELTAAEAGDGARSGPTRADRSVAGDRNGTGDQPTERNVTANEPGDRNGAGDQPAVLTVP
ncbi:hypothetical protein [Sphaerisporangium perillae]|uniref:hypothetical protein n=1 Tax=Sphaerisporangium perillae TaxID=2935860 RepID=UPI00200D0880|nr:hypothetical protein [Sphaerisporangium perillae]